MPLNIPDGFGNCYWRWSLLGDPEEMLTSCGVDNVGIVTGQAVAEDLADDWTQAFIPANYLNSYTFRGTYVDIGTPEGEPIRFQADRAIAGTNVSPPMPQNTAFLVKKFTGLGGRRGRGRMYLPGWLNGEDSVSAVGMISTVSVPVLQARIDAWLETSFPKVLLHNISPAQPVPLTPTPITNFLLDPMVATMRRRLRR